VVSRLLMQSIGATLLALVTGCGPAMRAGGAPSSVTGAGPGIDAVVIYPPMAAPFQCSEHPLGQEDHAGDALGSDCRVVRQDGGPLGTFPRFHTGDGTRNEDWFTWNEPLLAPFEGVVRLILRNPVTNQPGTRGPDPSSAVLFERLGDPPGAPIQVGYVHVQDVQVEMGDTVHTGQVVARVGNNGNSRAPHVHIGAMRGDLTKLFSGEATASEIIPLQVRFDLTAMGRLHGFIR
jgi:peptidase M23-like protein